MAYSLPISTDQILQIFWTVGRVSFILGMQYTSATMEPLFNDYRVLRPPDLVTLLLNGHVHEQALQYNGQLFWKKKIDVRLKRRSFKTKSYTMYLHRPRNLIGKYLFTEALLQTAIVGSIEYHVKKPMASRI